MFDLIVGTINNLLWGEGQILIYILLFTGIWFSVRLKLIQILKFKHMFSLLRTSSKCDKNDISSFQALCTGLSARVGTGNLAGVAVAISLGGSGAIFWMWMIAILGMATGFAESVLGQVYKVRDSNGEFRGGPAYYIQQGIGSKTLAIAFALCLFLGYGFTFSAMQTNTITDALNYAFEIPTFYSGIVITILAGSIILGGFKAIARFAERVVPIMGIVFVLAAVIITLINFTQVPAMLKDIFLSAFGLQEAGAGAMGAAIKNGIQRGLYSNEAGAGSVPHASACATPIPNHPVTQGYIQMLGVFFDTIVLCSCTAVIILLADVDISGEMEGIRLTQEAMTAHLAQGGVYFVAAAITLFAFTSVVANYAYAESNLHLFKLDNKIGRGIYTFLYLSMMMWGASATLKEVWDLADIALGLMTVVNVIAIIILTPTILAVTADYNKQRAQNAEPEFNANKVNVQGKTEKGIWH
ncbi:MULTISPECIES: alanine/glycine:cation symporter family protein [unclassified Pseudoalteromonas]|uniref:alanine/glycine:cation symporter family protein n=1 Tax=unclassified Pseudoalteromonas TaxID=194690 RepID=UPI0025B48BFF|nr:MULTISPECIES: alanine/glycine:cation symporter family protein [unclassified Pseudoalteromonas]MDN3380702.1 alanine/glycine:cation symporter family protein [Pseudoalteromonas sp. APC 3893]MDN3389089.1 alanine/glycine:cation symporter family protein [Pseudoalteromonas sp. APC 4017]